MHRSSARPVATCIEPLKNDGTFSTRGIIARSTNHADWIDASAMCRTISCLDFSVPGGYNQELLPPNTLSSIWPSPLLSFQVSIILRTYNHAWRHGEIRDFESP
jgi:hypothetical protein